MNPLEALLRGYGQGATLGWGDEGAAKLLDLLPKNKDPEGIPREYAAGDSEKDYLQNFRADNSAAASEFPATYAAGGLAGATPLALSAPIGGVGSAAGRLAAAGLTGGALGGVGGAGLAEEDKLRGAGKGALAGSLMGLGGAAAAESLPLLEAASGLAPKLASAEAGASGGAQINQANAIHPPARTSGVWEMPSIPKAGKSPISESLIPAADDLAEAADVIHGQKMLGKDLKSEDVNKFVKLRDQVKAGSKKEPAEPFPAEEVSQVVKTVRPPRGKRSAAAPVVEKKIEIQQELPGVDSNQRSQVDFANAKQRFQDASKLLSDTPAESQQALQNWIHESRSGHSSTLNDLPEGDYGVGYRGLKMTPEQLNAALKQGNFPHDEVSSWSVNPDTAKSFGNVVLRQSNVRGVPVGRNEGEVLAAPPGKLSVTRVTQDPEGFTHIDVRKALEEMPKENVADENQLDFFK